MPPKQKFTREEIVDAAVNLIRSDGLSAVTARTLGSILGSSSRPIFTAFKNMEEVQSEAIKAIRQIYNKRIEKALKEDAPFRSVGQQYIKFAQEEPRLFQILFMTQSQHGVESQNVLDVLDDNSKVIVETIKEEYQLNYDLSMEFYQELWVFTHGIATLIATGVCSFTLEEIQKMSADVCLGVLQQIRKKKENES